MSVLRDRSILGKSYAHKFRIFDFLKVFSLQGSEEKSLRPVDMYVHFCTQIVRRLEESKSLKNTNYLKRDTNE